MTWTQGYDPFGHWWLSTVVAALPIVVLFCLLAVFRVRPHLAALAGATTATCSASFASVTGLPESDLNAMIGRILPFASVLVPFWLVRTMVGWRKTFEVLPAVLVVGVSFALTQFLWSNFVDSNLVDIVGGMVSLAATVLFLRFWKPRRVWRFPRDAETDIVAESRATEDARARGDILDDTTHHAATRNDGRRAARDSSHRSHRRGAARRVAKAWMPFVILSAFVVVWGLPQMKDALNRWTTPAYERKGWDVPMLHNGVTRAAPVVSKPAPEAAKYDFNWLSATGTGCFLSALVTGLLLGLRPRELFRIFGRTIYRMRFAVLAIAFMLGLGFVTRYSGMDAVLGLAFTRTGVLFPFFGTFLGWLGVALTGSDTSSNALFGGLQRITAEQLKLDPVLMCAANSAGGVMGKMVDAQSIVVATAATNQLGNEGRIFRFVLWHSVALGAFVGLIVLAYAYLFQWAVPHGLNFIR